ncbi:F-box/LRR-repeat protein 6 [Osmerus eperlanus]|uniref:F-box/LRR-repeat protein 6 n=1 Tax=Osmerus eperlanus TaxID=29151 RepID=UPI002E0FFB28
MEPEGAISGASPSGTNEGNKNEVTKRKRSLKREASNAPKNVKPKKKKRNTGRRPPRPNYTVQEGDGMLLIISNTSSFDNVFSPKRRVNKKKLAVRKAKVIKRKKTNVCPKRVPKKTPPIKNVEREVAPYSSEESSGSWGQSLPVEVLVNIFQMLVSENGAVPFLCRMARVCNLWNAAASTPALWRTVSLGYCWIEPGKTQLPKTELKIRNTISWLAQNRFSQVRDFSLCHWKKQVDHVLEVVSQSCPHLRSLKLSYCTGATTKAFSSLGEHCHSLKSINVQYSEFDMAGLVSLLESHGSQIRQMLFTYGPKNDRLLSAISRGCCPELELLEINTKLDSGYCQLPLSIQALQRGCPKLQTFRMLNVTPLYKTVRSGPECLLGFPLLEELCIATASFSVMKDQDLKNILYGSTKLRVLDLRGCYGISTAGLAALPCEKLECLYWGLYKVSLSSCKKDLHLLTQKWSCTLQEMDLTNQLFSEDDMEISMGQLAQGPGADSLHSLNLTGTKITIPALRLIISQATALNYLNLSSCRNLPRGLKRVYRGQEDIHQLLEKLE